MIVDFLIKLFVAISEKWFLDWYDRAKERSANNAVNKDIALPDDAVADKLRDKWTR